MINLVTPTNGKFTVRKMVERNNTIIKKIVDLEKCKQLKLKWQVFKPKPTCYRPLSDRGILSDFKLHKTIVPGLQRFTLQKGSLPPNTLTTEEILINSRDVDSKQDKRLSMNATAYYDKALGSVKKHRKVRKPSILNKTSYTPKLNNPFRSAENSPRSHENTTANEFFITGEGQGKFYIFILYEI